jgi:hypothetical protein
VSERIRNLIVVTAVVLFGAGVVGYYTAWLKRDELRDWRQIEVVFENVEGLEVKDSVLLNGARVGRVAKIRIWKARQRVVLEVEPGLELYSEGIGVEIVPVNALGAVAIDLNPGKAGSPPLAEGVLLEGRIRPALGAGGGTPTPGRRKELADSIRAYADETDRLLLPDHGTVGNMLFSRERGQQIRESLASFADFWQGVDEGLRVAENRQSAKGVLSRESLLTALETTRSFAATTTAFRDGVRRIQRRESTSGRLLADPALARDLDQALREIAKGLAKIRRYEGPVGALLDPKAAQAKSLQATVDRLEVVSKAGNRGEGLLGILSSADAGKSLRNTIEGAEGTLRRLKESELVSGKSAREDAQDALGNVDDLLRNMRLGLSGLRAGLPDKNFQGVVFAVF